MTAEQKQYQARIITYAKALRERFARGMLIELQSLKQWVLWRRETRGGKLKKVPYSPLHGYHASVNNPGTWGTLTHALFALEKGCFEGLGFMLTKNDPFCFIDLDHTYDRENKRITSATALRVVRLLNSYTEASPNDGLHILVKAKLPGKGIHSNIELYDQGRFLTITTRHIDGTPLAIEERQTEVENLYEEYQPLPNPVRESTRVGVKGPVAATTRDILEKARQAPNGKLFQELWQGGWQTNPRYLSSGKPDQSKADFQLVKYLLYWTGNDPVLTDTLFRRSSLMREKWDDNTNSGGSGHTYGEITIHNASGRKG